MKQIVLKHCHTSEGSFHQLPFCTSLWVTVKQQNQILPNQHPNTKKPQTKPKNQAALVWTQQPDVINLSYCRVLETSFHAFTEASVNDNALLINTGMFLTGSLQWKVNSIIIHMVPWIPLGFTKRFSSPSLFCGTTDLVRSQNPK